MPHPWLQLAYVDPFEIVQALLLRPGEHVHSILTRSTTKDPHAWLAEEEMAVPLDLCARYVCPRLVEQAPTSRAMLKEEGILQWLVVARQGRNETWLLATSPIKDGLSWGYLAEIVRSNDCSELTTHRRDGELNSKGYGLVWDLTNGVPQGPHIGINQTEENRVSHVERHGERQNPSHADLVRTCHTETSACCGLYLRRPANGGRQGLLGRRPPDVGDERIDSDVNGG